MFGYVRAELPYLYIKDDALYKALYCGVCKGIAKTCGNAARVALSYDVAFLSAAIHNIAGVDITVEKQHCLTHCIRSRQMAEVDEISMQLGALNTLLAYYKCMDDVEDNEGGRAKRAFLKSGFRKAKKKYPELERIVRENLSKQSSLEKQKIASVDRAADATANMLAEVCDSILGEKTTPAAHNLFYAVGKWIYLIDALDDYDKDLKKGNYNPFALSYNAACKKELLSGKSAEEIAFTFNAIFYDIRENLSQIKFHFNRDLTDNILLRGLPSVTKLVMQDKRLDGKCKKCKKEKKTNTK